MTRLIRLIVLVVGLCLTFPVFGDSYSDFNQSVAQYNAAATAWNNGSAFFPQINNAVDAFNTQVNSFNSATHFEYPQVAGIAGPDPMLYLIIDRSGNPQADALIPPVGPYDTLAAGIVNGTTDRLTFNQFVATFNPQLLAWEAAVISVFPAWDGVINVQDPPAQQLAPATIAASVPEPAAAAIAALPISIVMMRRRRVA